ncbi:hypothetical protein ACJMK2_016367 [Sinanodonta woodiana]|uniref:Uncharacterized protein n=1 Tax=Sinanodonta woodiana TaxID=1069815 RepID=A0ABD3UUH6_SINWO
MEASGLSQKSKRTDNSKKHGQNVESSVCENTNVVRGGGEALRQQKMDDKAHCSHAMALHAKTGEMDSRVLMQAHQPYRKSARFQRRPRLSARVSHLDENVERDKSFPLNRSSLRHPSSNSEQKICRDSSYYHCRSDPTTTRERQQSSSNLYGSFRMAISSEVETNHCATIASNNCNKPICDTELEDWSMDLINLSQSDVLKEVMEGQQCMTTIQELQPVPSPDSGIVKSLYSSTAYLSENCDLEIVPVTVTTQDSVPVMMNTMEGIPTIMVTGDDAATIVNTSPEQNEDSDNNLGGHVLMSCIEEIKSLDLQCTPKITNNMDRAYTKNTTLNDNNSFAKKTESSFAPTLFQNVSYIKLKMDRFQEPEDWTDELTIVGSPPQLENHPRICLHDNVSQNIGSDSLKEFFHSSSEIHPRLQVKVYKKSSVSLVTDKAVDIKMINAVEKLGAGIASKDISVNESNLSLTPEHEHVHKMECLVEEPRHFNKPEHSAISGSEDHVHEQRILASKSLFLKNTLSEISVMHTFEDSKNSELESKPLNEADNHPNLLINASFGPNHVQELNHLQKTSVACHMHKPKLHVKHILDRAAVQDPKVLLNKSNEPELVGKSGLFTATFESCPGHDPSLSLPDTFVDCNEVGYTNSDKLELYSARGSRPIYSVTSSETFSTDNTAVGQLIPEVGQLLPENTPTIVENAFRGNQNQLESECSTQYKPNLASAVERSKENCRISTTLTNSQNGTNLEKLKLTVCNVDVESPQSCTSSKGEIKDFDVDNILPESRLVTSLFQADYRAHESIISSHDVSEPNSIKYLNVAPMRSPACHSQQSSGSRNDDAYNDNDIAANQDLPYHEDSCSSEDEGPLSLKNRRIFRTVSQEDFTSTSVFHSFADERGSKDRGQRNMKSHYVPPISSEGPLSLKTRRIFRTVSQEDFTSTSVFHLFADERGSKDRGQRNMKSHYVPPISSEGPLSLKTRRIFRTVSQEDLTSTSVFHSFADERGSKDRGRRNMKSHYVPPISSEKCYQKDLSSYSFHGFEPAQEHLDVHQRYYYHFPHSLSEWEHWQREQYKAHQQWYSLYRCTQKMGQHPHHFENETRVEDLCSSVKQMSFDSERCCEKSLTKVKTFKGHHSQNLCGDGSIKWNCTEEQMGRAQIIPPVGDQQYVRSGGIGNVDDELENLHIFEHETSAVINVKNSDGTGKEQEQRTKKSTQQNRKTPFYVPSKTAHKKGMPFRDESIIEQGDALEPERLIRTRPSEALGPYTCYSKWMQYWLWYNGRIPAGIQPSFCNISNTPATLPHSPQQGKKISSSRSRSDQGPFGWERSGQGPFGWERSGQRPFGWERSGQGPFGWERSDQRPFGWERSGQGPFGWKRSDQEQGPHYFSWDTGSQSYLYHGYKPAAKGPEERPISSYPYSCGDAWAYTEHMDPTEEHQSSSSSRSSSGPWHNKGMSSQTSSNMGVAHPLKNPISVLAANSFERQQNFMETYKIPNIPTTVSQDARNKHEDKISSVLNLQGGSMYGSSKHHCMVPALSVGHVPDSKTLNIPHRVRDEFIDAGLENQVKLNYNNSVKSVNKIDSSLKGMISAQVVSPRGLTEQYTSLSFGSRIDNVNSACMSSHFSEETGIKTNYQPLKGRYNYMTGNVPFQDPVNNKEHMLISKGVTNGQGQSTVIENAASPFPYLYIPTRMPSRNMPSNRQDAYEGITIANTKDIETKNSNSGCNKDSRDKARNVKYSSFEDQSLYTTWSPLPYKAASNVRGLPPFSNPGYCDQQRTLSSMNGQERRLLSVTPCSDLPGFYPYFVQVSKPRSSLELSGASEYGGGMIHPHAVGDSDEQNAKSTGCLSNLQTHSRSALETKVTSAPALEKRHHQSACNYSRGSQDSYQPVEHATIKLNSSPSTYFEKELEKTETTSQTGAMHVPRYCPPHKRRCYVPSAWSDNSPVSTAGKSHRFPQHRKSSHSLVASNTGCCSEESSSRWDTDSDDSSDVSVASQESFTMPYYDPTRPPPVLPPFPARPFWNTSSESSVLKGNDQRKSFSSGPEPGKTYSSDMELVSASHGGAIRKRGFRNSGFNPRSSMTAGTGHDSPSIHGDWKTNYNTRVEGYGETYIDSHCHLDFLFKRSGFKGTFTQFRELNKHAFPKTYEGCVAVFCNPASFKPTGGLWMDVGAEEDVWLAFGCHPKMATDFIPRAEQWLQECMQHPKVVALGEIGLDYSGKFRQYEAVQKDVFRRQLKIAVKMSKPLVIHCRDAEMDCLSILKEMVPSDYKIHCHCFTGFYKNAVLWMEAFSNLYIGLTPLVTYPTAVPSHDLAKYLPLSKLLLETDAPYFIPRQVPKKEVVFSHPGFAVTVAEEVARIKDIPVSTVLNAARRNTRDMYGI